MPETTANKIAVTIYVNDDSYDRQIETAKDLNHAILQRELDKMLREISEEMMKDFPA